MSTQTQLSIEKIRQLVADTLPCPPASSGLIFGAGGPLDSLGLVSFVSDLEYRLAQELGRKVTLASEQAMSRSRSPFRDISALSEYIVELLNK